MSGAEYVDATYRAMTVHGFDADNTIGCVAVCRDELTRPLIDEIRRAWGESFNFGSLAGMVFLGRTGFLAALAHAPVFGGRRRQVFYAFPHLGIDAAGGVGRCKRPGLQDVSSACGALVALRHEMAQGRWCNTLDLDPDDVERSLLSWRMANRITPPEVPDLVTLTRLARELILEDIERLVCHAQRPETYDFAVFTGIQIHGPSGETLVAPEVAYAIIEGKRHDLPIASAG